MSCFIHAYHAIYLVQCNVTPLPFSLLTKSTLRQRGMLIPTENICTPTKSRRPQPQKIRATLTSYSAERHLCGPSHQPLYPTKKTHRLVGYSPPMGPPVIHIVPPFKQLTDRWTARTLVHQSERSAMMSGSARHPRREKITYHMVRASGLLFP